LPPTPVYREKVAISTAAIVKISPHPDPSRPSRYGRAAFRLQPPVWLPEDDRVPAVETPAVSWEDGSNHRGVTP